MSESVRASSGLTKSTCVSQTSRLANVTRSDLFWNIIGRRPYNASGTSVKTWWSEKDLQIV